MMIASRWHVPRCIMSLLVFAAAGPPLLGTSGDPDPAPALQEAVETYDAAMATTDPDERIERFRRAGRLFARVIETTDNRNAALYVNLANASLQANELGDAVLAYRRALVLQPAHAQANRNLEYARAMLPDWVPRPAASGLFDTFFFWFREVSPAGRRLATALVFAVAAICAAIAVRMRRRGARHLAIIVTLVWLTLLAATAWERRPGRAEEVVVTAPRAICRSADSSGAPPRFTEPLPAGTEATALDQRDNWVQIQLADGRDGWMRRNAVTIVAPTSP